MVSPNLLWSDVQGEPSVPVIVQLRQCLLPLGTLALDRQLVLASRPMQGCVTSKPICQWILSPGIDNTLDLFAHGALPQALPTANHLTRIAWRLHHHLEWTLLHQPAWLGETAPLDHCHSDHVCSDAVCCQVFVQ